MSYLYNKDEMTPREKEIADYYAKEGAKHTKSSPETKELFKQMKEEFSEQLRSTKEEIGKDIRLALAEFKNDFKCQLDDEYASKEEVKENRDEIKFWRNILVSGILISIALGLFGIIIAKISN